MIAIRVAPRGINHHAIAFTGTTVRTFGFAAGVGAALARSVSAKLALERFGAVVPPTAVGRPGAGEEQT